MSKCTNARRLNRRSGCRGRRCLRCARRAPRRRRWRRKRRQPWKPTSGGSNSTVRPRGKGSPGKRSASSQRSRRECSANRGPLSARPGAMLPRGHEPRRRTSLDCFTRTVSNMFRYERTQLASKGKHRRFSVSFVVLKLSFRAVKVGPRLSSQTSSGPSPSRKGSSRRIRWTKLHCLIFFLGQFRILMNARSHTRRWSFCSPKMF